MKKKIFSLFLILIFFTGLNVFLTNIRIENNQKYQNLFRTPLKSIEKELTNNAYNITQINGSLASYYEISIYRFEAYNITFNLTTINDEPVKYAIANYTWYEKDDLSSNGTGELNESVNVPGLYTLNFNTSYRNIGEYIISVNFIKYNHSNPNLVIYLSIQKRPTVFLTLTGTNLALERGPPFILLFYLRDTLNKTSIDGLNIRWTMGFLSGSLISLPNGYYILPFPTEIFEVGSNIMILDASANQNYDIPSSVINIDITWEKILGIDAPIFYAIIIISIVIIAIIISYKLIRKAKVAQVIKKIDESLKYITKQKTPIPITGIKSREEIFSEIFKNDWKMIEKVPPTELKEENIV